MNRCCAQVAERSAVINYEHRMTGNGVIQIVDEIIEMKDRRQPRRSSDPRWTRFIESQVLIPGQWKPIPQDQLKGTSHKSGCSEPCSMSWKTAKRRSERASVPWHTRLALTENGLQQFEFFDCMAIQAT